MRTEVVMPQMGESVTEGTVTRWFKEVGEHVERDEPLFEITTDKVDAEVPSPVAGVVVERFITVGQTVAIHTLMAIVDTAAQPGQVASSATPAAAAPAPAQSVSAAASPTPTPAASAAPSTPVHHAANGAALGALAEVSGEASIEELRRTRSTPLVRRIAEEHNIADLSPISGTGIQGRVTKRDILSFIEAGQHKAPAAPAHKPAPQAARPPPAHPQIAHGAPDTHEPHAPQRLAIAEHMIRSRATSAHAHTVHEIDFARVFKAREQLKDEFASRGVKLTYTAFMVQAVAQALRAYPLVNSSVDGESIVFRGDINVGIAVALESSLIVPVLKNVDEMSLLGIARAISDLSERARNKRLKPDEVRGGTFTLSNHGIYGPEFGVPIINQPQTAIVSTGAIKKRVVVDEKTDAIMIRPTSIWCMSFDHRVIDGATADQFMASIRKSLESWTV